MENLLDKHELKPCPFCGAKPKRYVRHEILHIQCPNCVSIGFHNHIRFRCMADTMWQTRVDREKD